MNTIRFFSLLLVMAFVGCERPNDKIVIIHSVPADSIFKEINISTNDPKQKNIVFKGGENCIFSVDSVAVCNFESNSNGNQFYTKIFITQGDSVSFKTIAKDEKIYEVIFKGKNASHYNYFSEKRKVFPREEEPNYNLGIDLLSYKQQLRVYRDRENEFLRNYRKKYIVSEDFINYVLAEIGNFYTFKLYQAAYFNKCGIPKGYLDDADITQNPLSFYAIPALELKYIGFSLDENIEQIYNTILDEVHSKFQSTLLYTLITHFAQKGDRAYKKTLLQVMGLIEKTSTDSILLAAVREYKPYYLLSGTMLPDNILDKTYLRSFQSKQKITLRQFFNNYKNTSIYIDFWASWCGPCRYTNRISVENKPYFVQKQIAVVYMSIDEDENAWLQAAKDDRITENQYLLLDNNSPVNDYLKIRKGGIPRFVLFNKKHEIEILDAPRPIDCSFEELRMFIECFPEKIVKEKPIINNPAKKKMQKETIFNDCEDSTKFFVKTIYHDNFGTFSSPTSYVDAWGVSRTPAKNWQTKYSPYTIPKHKMIFGAPEDGYYTIGTLKKGVMRDNMRGGMTKDASGDPNGAVLCINVAENYMGEIYHQQVDNLSPNVILYFEVSIANASFVNNTTPPQVEIRIEKTDGKLLSNAHSNLTPATFGWQKINIEVPPTTETSVVLRVISTGENWLAGCDLLMDDVIFRTCSRR